MDITYKEDFFGNSFGKIIAHVFPGFIFLTEIILLFFPESNLFETWRNLKLTWDQQLILFFIFLFIGTIAGVIIDAIANFIIEEVVDRIVHKIQGKDFKRARNTKEEPFNIDTLAKLEIYKYLTDEWAYYWYQAWSNTAISLTLLPIIIWKSHISFKYLILSIILLVILILFYMGYRAYDNWLILDKQVSKEFGKK